MPLILAKFRKVFPIISTPLLTEDQLKLLKYDNIPTGKFKTNLDIGFKAKKNLRQVKKYSYNWKSGGQYSIKNKLSSNE